MAFSSLNNAWTQWYQANRPGTVVAGSGTPGTCLVSDLQANDYLVGLRATVVTHDTAGTNRDEVVERNGVQFTATMVAASSVVIIRP